MSHAGPVLRSLRRLAPVVGVSVLTSLSLTGLAAHAQEIPPQEVTVAGSFVCEGGTRSVKWTFTNTRVTRMRFQQVNSAVSTGPNTPGLVVTPGVTEIPRPTAVHDPNGDTPFAISETKPGTLNVVQRVGQSDTSASFSADLVAVPLVDSPFPPALGSPQSVRVAQSVNAGNGFACNVAVGATAYQGGAPQSANSEIQAGPPERAALQDGSAPVTGDPAEVPVGQLPAGQTPPADTPVGDPALIDVPAEDEEQSVGQAVTSLASTGGSGSLVAFAVAILAVGGIIFLVTRRWHRTRPAS